MKKINLHSKRLVFKTEKISTLQEPVITSSQQRAIITVPTNECDADPLTTSIGATFACGISVLAQCNAPVVERD